MNSTSLKFCVAAFAALLLFPSIGLAEATIEVSGTFDNRCYLTTFEGNPDLQPVGSIGNEEMTFTFDDTWLTGPSTPYLDGPSPPTMCVLWADDHGEIAFSRPVSNVSLYYLTIYEDVTLTAYDINGDIIATVTGQPGRLLEAGTWWTTLSLDTPTADIAKISFAGPTNGCAIDDLQVCRVIDDPVELLEDLILSVADINYAQGISNALDGKLDAILAAISDVNENNDAGACNALDALVIYVESQWSVGRLTDEQALYLIDAAGTIAALLCPE